MGSMGSHASHQTTSDVGLAVVLDRLPSRVTADDVTLRLRVTDVGAGRSGPRARSVPVRWSTARRGSGQRRGDGRLEVAPLACGRTRLELHLDAAAGPRLEMTAPRLLRGLREHLQAPSAPDVARPHVRPTAGRRRALAAAALISVPAVALLSATLLASPTPVSVDDRVAHFRADVATDPVAGPTDGPVTGGELGRATVDREAGTDEKETAGQASPEERRPEPVADEGDAGATEVTARRGADASAATSGGSAGPRDDEPTAPRPRRPEPGVYQYATTGGDRLSMRGSARDYPETTSVTVRHDDCGFTQRWDVFDERWEERRWCVEDEGRALTAMSSYREFFGRGQRNDLACEGRTPAADAIEPGVGWTVVCDDGDTRSTTRIEVGGRAEIEVDGGAVETRHLRLETTVEGESTGRMDGQQWVVPETGLLVREQWETEVETAGPMGPVTYTEDYTLWLESMEPSR
jgi:hypothetical protein